METSIQAKLQRLKNFYDKGDTKTADFVKGYLLKLKNVLIEKEEAIFQALYSDLNKSPEECYITEISVVMKELNYFLKKINRLRKPVKVKSGLVNFPSSSYIYPDPLGVVLIVSPWNYPLNLSLAPLVAALAAGNTVVVKPSEKAPATAALINDILLEVFPEEYVLVVNGEGSKVIPEMMQDFQFGHIFFTGNQQVGKTIYREAANQLVPVTLELGGKSPAIVTSSADIAFAAKRITLPKFINAGQTCVAPDYVVAHSSVKEELINAIRKCILQFYGNDPVNNPDYGKIINKEAFNRLKGYLKEGEIIYGGKTDEESLKIEPTIITNILPGAAILKEEVFGPVLPVISYETGEDLEKIIKANGQPLAMYLFTKDKEIEKQFIKNYSFGGGCINNAGVHFMNPYFPFGGVGTSGIGAYHGKYGFDRFTHYKPVISTPSWPDPSIKYPPYKNKLKLLRKLL